jgi:HAD superfamily hydrolase (TIGR01484 family)
MRYHVLATDYDGTLAHNGTVSPSSVDALKRLLASGRQLVLVTGRELPELKEVFPEINLFRWVVAENGGLLYEPASTKEHRLGESPSEKLVSLLKTRGVSPISVGQSIIATWSPFEQVVLDSIRELGLELQVIFNKGAVMVLPAGVNKASGLEQALREMKLSRHNTVGVGDAENDHSFLQIVEYSAAVSNALPSLREAVDLVLPHSHGQGVEFLIEQILLDDLRAQDKTSKRNRLSIATVEGEDVCIPSYSGPTLICGPSGSGKSTLSNRIVDTITQEGYQFCLIDPEGDYESFEGAVVLGGPNSVPRVDEVLHVLDQPEANVVVCLTGIAIPERPAFFLQLLTGLSDLRSQTARPHWLILDEAHHLIPADWGPSTDYLPPNWKNVVLITVQPSLLPAHVLQQVDTFAFVGDDPTDTIQNFLSVVEVDAPHLLNPTLNEGEIFVWSVRDPSKVIRCKPIRSQRQHHRHRRKYAEGQLPPERSFYFRGPTGRLNLRAQNLILFCQLAEGVDDLTWQFHLRNGDYRRWFKESIKDDELAAETFRIEQLPDLSPSESKKLVLEAIQRTYTLPATSLIELPGAS